MDVTLLWLGNLMDVPLLRGVRPRSLMDVTLLWLGNLMNVARLGGLRLGSLMDEAWSKQVRLEEGLYEPLASKESLGEAVVVLRRPIRITTALSPTFDHGYALRSANTGTVGHFAAVSFRLAQTEQTLHVTRIVFTILQLKPRLVHELEVDLSFVEAIMTALKVHPEQSLASVAGNQEWPQRSNPLVRVGPVDVTISFWVCVVDGCELFL